MLALKQESNIMNTKRVKKWSLIFLGFVLVSSFITFIWMDYQINRMWGGQTEVVNYDQFRTPQQTIAITNPNILSPDAGLMVPNQTVIIESGMITAVSNSPSIPDNAKVVNGKGKYLIPGLVDSHIHLWQSQNDLLLYLANGVTHIRELNGDEEHLTWKKAIHNGRPGPDLFVASARINSNGFFAGLIEDWTANMMSMNSNGDAEKIYNNATKQQFDAIKVYTHLDKEHFLALDKSSRSHKLPLLGHIPKTVTLDDIWQSNMTELAHTEELVKALFREFGSFNRDKQDELISFIESRSNDIAKHIIEKDMAVVSTIKLIEGISAQRHAPLEESLRNVELAYVNPGITELSPLSSKVMGWLPDSNIYRIAGNHTQDALESDKLYWEAYIKANHILLKVLSEKNAKILAGTDANVPIMVPGFSLHKELESLVKIGLTEQQVLFSATVAPASHMKILSGQIKIGYQADLVLLDKNPLDNISNTRAINTVISNGRLYSRDTLDMMLEAVEDANDHSRQQNIKDFTDSGHAH
jgi:hypothetical protein